MKNSQQSSARQKPAIASVIPRYSGAGFDVRQMLERNLGDRVAAALQGFRQVKIPELLEKYPNLPAEAFTKFLMDYAKDYFNEVQTTLQKGTIMMAAEENWAEKQSLYYLRLSASGAYTLRSDDTGELQEVKDDEVFNLEHLHAQKVLGSVITRTNNVSDAVFKMAIGTSFHSASKWLMMRHSPLYSGFIRN